MADRGGATLLDTVPKACDFPLNDRGVYIVADVIRTHSALLVAGQICHPPAGD
jgi:hypothetical protein